MALFNIVVQVSDQLAHCFSPAWFLCQAEGFHGELEEFLQWLRRTESQLSAAKPTGGLPETAREQLQQHMVRKMSSPLVHPNHPQIYYNLQQFQMTGNSFKFYLFI